MSFYEWIWGKSVIDLHSLGRPKVVIKIVMIFSFFAPNLYLIQTTNSDNISFLKQTT